MTTYTPNPKDPTKPADGDDSSEGAAEFRALKQYIAQLVSSGGALVNPLSNQSGLTNLLYPSVDTFWKDIYKGGWLPAFFNQQWGGAQWGHLPDGSFGDVATGYIPSTDAVSIGDAAARNYISQGFKVAENLEVAALWMRMYKQGNPSDNITAYILPDDGTGKPSGSASIANGTANVLPLKSLTSNANGEWYRLVFATPPSLVAGTQYHLVLHRSGAYDASNFAVSMRQYSGMEYPHGVHCWGDGTPVWTVEAGTALNFLVEPVAANMFLQAGGHFDARLIFEQGTPINQSKVLCQPLKNFFDGKFFTALHRISSPALSTPIADYLYGIDHDRLLLSTNNNGYAVVQLWDMNGNLHTITGNTALNVTGMSDVAVVGRFMNDGQDYLQLWVAGAKQAEITLQSFAMSNSWKQLGTAWLGGGHAAAPAWTQALTMASLPSANGWTWTGTAAEANAMSIQGGKLYQNKNGYAATDTGYYLKANAGLSNANGWEVTWKGRVGSSSNSSTSSEAEVLVQDGVKNLELFIQEYFLQIFNRTTSTIDFTIQGDFKTVEHVFKLCGKGSDYFLFIDGKLAIDGTGKLTATSANNQIEFGDTYSGSGNNADAVWSYIKYNTASNDLPVINSGMALHEYAYWSGDKSAYLTSMYNNGSQISAKAWCGAERNYAGDLVGVRNTVDLNSVVNVPTTTSTNLVPLPDSDAFVLGSTVHWMSVDYTVQANTQAVNFGYYVDGVTQFKQNELEVGFDSITTFICDIPVLLGLHKCNIMYSTTNASYTASSYSRRRQFGGSA